MKFHHVHGVHAGQCRTALALAIVMGLATAASVHAQDAQQIQPAPDSNTAAKSQDKAKNSAINLGEVTVTARKTKELASTTPIALTAVSGDDLKSAGITSILEIGDVSPGVMVSKGPGGIDVNMRGVTTSDQTSKGEQDIAFLIDGVPIERGYVEGLSFFDLQSVEVLRGPQGTMYGANTTGGVINVITNKPQNTFDASADVEFGNYDTRRENGMINIPVNDVLALRFAVNANDREGYIWLNNGGTPRSDEHDSAVRGSALFTFTPDTTLLLTVTGDHVGGVGPSTVPIANVLGNSSGSAQREGFTNPFGGHLDDYNRAFNTEFNTVFGGVQMTAVGGASEYSADELTSFTSNPDDNLSMGPPGAPGVGLPQYGWSDYTGTFKTYTGELRFNNAEPGPLTWVAGINYLYENITEDQHGLNAPLVDPSIANSMNGTDIVDNTDHHTAGVFGQANYNLTDDWRITAGLRYSKDSLSRVGYFATGPGPACANPLVPCTSGLPDNATERDSKPTYRLGTDYTVAPGQMLYASVSTGFKPGGFNDFDYTTHGFALYLPEQLTSYEAGYKGRFGDWLTLNSDFYYYDYSRDQITSLSLVNGAPIVFTRTVPATLYGLENDLNIKLTNADKLKFSASFERSHYDNFMAGVAENVDWTGKSLDMTPHAVLTLGYTHEWALASGAYLAAYLGTKYSTSYYLSDFVNAVQYRQGNYTRTDATLTYTASSDHYYVQLFAKNLENKVQMLFLGPSDDVSISEPRYVGIRLGIRMN